MKPIAMLTLGAAMFLASSTLAGEPAADYCDEGLRELLTGARAYQPRDGNRCEGEYAQQVNSGLLEVLSFLAADIDYAVDQPADLAVGWSRPPRVDGAVRLRGSSLRHEVYYRMDTAAVAPAETFDWSLDVLADLGVPDRDLGVAGWMGEGDDQVYLPLRVGQGSLPAARGRLRLTLVANYEISTLFVSVRRATWPASDAPLGEVVAEHPPDDFGFPAKQPIDIALERPSEAGFYAVEIGFKYDDNTTAGGTLTGTDTIHFYDTGSGALPVSGEADR